MLSKIKNNKGFTIVEVMIVLAIGAMIIVIAFLAVPALQRNSRNQQIRSDASNLLGYVNDFAANNSGALPGGVCVGTNGDVGMVASGTCNTTTAKVGQIRGGTAVNTSAGFPTATNEVRINLNARCSTAAPNTTAPTAQNRSVAATFRVETGGGTATQCIGS